MGRPKVELWKAGSDTRDFRESRWTSSEIARDGDGGYQARVGKPADGFQAFFARLAYPSSLGHRYYLSTNVEVVGTKPRLERLAAGGWREPVNREQETGN